MLKSYNGHAGYHADTSRLVLITKRPRSKLPTLEEAHDFADEMQDTGKWEMPCTRITSDARVWSFWREPTKAEQDLMMTGRWRK